MSGRLEGRGRGRSWARSRLRTHGSRRATGAPRLGDLPAREGLVPDLVFDPDRIRRHRHSWAGHKTVLFLVLTGLADGLAPKEWRYAVAIRPNSWVPRFQRPPSWTGAWGIQLYGRGHANSAAGRKLRFWRKLRTIRAQRPWPRTRPRPGHPFPEGCQTASCPRRGTSGARSVRAGSAGIRSRSCAARATQRA